jgi:hypothetical protein
VLTALAVGLGVAGLPAASQAVSGGSAVAAGTHQFLARISAAGTGCTGSLVDPQWVITSASCVPLGAAATVSVNGLPAVEVTKATRHSDRDVAVLKLAIPVAGVTPIALGTTAPAVNDSLKVVGLGRTATEWVPDRAHVTTSTVSAVTAQTLALTGEKDTCLGDAGGPAIRETGGAQQLVALHSTSWQHGCLAVSETRGGSTETRVDDLGDWVRRSIVPTPIRCGPVQVWTVRPNGDLHRYVHHDAATGGLSWSGGTAVGNGWFGRMLSGGGNVVWDLHKRINGNDPVGDGQLKRWVWNDAGFWTGGAVVGSGWERYLTPEHRNRVTVDSTGRIFVIDDQGRLRHFAWDAARGTWVNGGGETVEGGWDRFDSITAAGDGVLYARKPDGAMFRFRYDVAAKTFSQRDKPVGVGWQMFSEITSPGADVLYGRGARGADPWGTGTVPVLRWYQHHDNTDSWAPGAADGTGRSVGTGWDTETSVSAQPDACALVR